MSEVHKSKDNGAACGCGGGSCCSGRGRWIWVILALAIAGVLIAKNAGKKQVSASAAATASPAVVGTTGTQGVLAAASQGQTIPRLVDLGATKCIPCKMMAPILEELKTTYTGKLDVQFIDVWENPKAGDTYGIKVIPTQIFYDAAGKELFRHEGFYGKDDILAKWKEFGVELTK